MVGLCLVIVAKDLLIYPIMRERRVYWVRHRRWDPMGWVWLQYAFPVWGRWIERGRLIDLGSTFESAVVG